MTRAGAIAVLAAVASAGACGAAQRPAASRTPTLLDAIPASTPALIVTTRPVTPADLDRWFAVARDPEETATPTDVILDAFTTAAWLREAGFPEQLELVRYQVGVSAVTRMTAGDRGKLEAAIARLFAKAKVAHEVGERRGRRIWRFDGDEGRRVITTVRDHVVVARLGPDVTDADLPALLGEVLPAAPLRSDDVRARAAAYGGKARLLYWLEARGVGAASAPPCAEDYARLAKVVSRLDGAILDGPEVNLRFTLTFRADLARRIAGLRVEGLPSHRDAEALAWIGAGMELETLFGMLRDAAREVRTRPFGCEALTGLNQVAALTRIPQLPVTGVRGVEVAVTDLNNLAPSMTAWAVLHGRGARTAAASIFPLLGGAYVDVPDDGEPVVVATVPMFGSIHVAARGEVAAVANRKDGAARARALLAPAAAELPFLEMHFDTERIAARGRDPAKLRSWTLKVEPSAEGLTVWMQTVPID